MILALAYIALVPWRRTGAILAALALVMSSVAATATPPPAPVELPPDGSLEEPVAVLASSIVVAEPVATADPTPEPTLPPTAEPTRRPTPVPAPPVQLPAGTFLASYYGPGFYGNRLPCWRELAALGLGTTLERDTLGVAHRSLPCASIVTLRFGAREVALRVIDRGPGCTPTSCNPPDPRYAGREFDLTEAARAALGCSDLCRVEWKR